MEMSNMSQISIILLLSFYLPIIQSRTRVTSTSRYELLYWRDNNELLLCCRTSGSPSNDTILFRINETQLIYFTSNLTNFTSVSTKNVLKAATIVLPSLPPNMARFKLTPQYEGTYSCGNPNVNLWSIGVGPFTVEPFITKEKENQEITTTNGKNVIMTCPVPLGKLKQYYDIQWLAVASDEMNKYIINNAGNYSTLTINNVQDSDYRDYWCQVSVYDPADNRKWRIHANFKLQSASSSYYTKLALIGWSWSCAAMLLCCCINCFSRSKTCTSGPNSRKSHPQQSINKELESNGGTSDFVLHKHSCLGSGAFGTVFKATYKDFTCAAKMLNHHAQCLAAGIDAQANVQKEALKHFVMECHFLEDLSHENIIQHIDTIVDPTSNLPILVMELMDCNLKSYLEEHHPKVLPIFFQISLFLDISRGLEFLHSKNLIHRDICDDNVLLNIKDDVPKAKLSDFGMSKLIPWDHMSLTMTAIGHRQIYSPPEAAAYPIKYTNTLDVYALGILGLQITLVEVRIRACNDLLVKLSENHTLKNVIIACLNENGVHRPTSRDVVNMLTSLQ